MFNLFGKSQKAIAWEQQAELELRQEERETAQLLSPTATDSVCDYSSEIAERRARLRVILHEQRRGSNLLSV